LLKHHSLLLSPLAAELETVLSAYSRGGSVDLLTHYQTHVRGWVHTLQASYHPVHRSLHFSNIQEHMQRKLLLLLRIVELYDDIRTVDSIARPYS